jgi:hypothetical protein
MTERERETGCRVTDLSVALALISFEGHDHFVHMLKFDYVFTSLWDLPVLDIDHHIMSSTMFPPQYIYFLDCGLVAFGTVFCYIYLHQRLGPGVT